MNLISHYRDLEIAEVELEKMASTNSFKEMTEFWQNILIRLERIWERAEPLIKKEEKGQKYLEPYYKQRRKDPLLRYIRQARNVEMHGIEGSIDKPLSLKISEKYGRKFRMDTITSSLIDGVLTINLDTPDTHLDYQIALEPKDPHLVRIKNRGEWYNPPTEHLGNHIRDLHPVFIAKIAIEFYGGFLKEADNHFGTRNS